MSLRGLHHVNNMNEQWRPVGGYEGLYEVSDHGRVRSLSRVVLGKKRQTVTGRMLGQVDNGHGYKTVRLWRGNRQRIVYVHEVVLTAFVGARPSGNWAAHNDGVRSNNRATNLRWDTPAMNHADKVRHGTALIGSRLWHAKLSEADVASIRRSLASGAQQQDVARQFGVKQATISNIHTGQTWKHVKETT